MSDTRKHFYASITGGMVAEALTLRLCTIKTLIQIQKDITIKQIIEKSSQTYTKALFPAIFAQAMNFSVKYTFYKSLVQYFPQTGSLSERCFLGALGGVMGCFVVHPFDVWKNFRQRDENLPNGSWKLWNSYPLMYRGLTKNISKSILLYSFLFPLQDEFKKHYRPEIASVLAAFVTSTITQPFDYLKTCFMSGIGKDINIRNAYRGFWWYAARNILHFSIAMGTTDLIESY